MEVFKLPEKMEKNLDNSQGMHFVLFHFYAKIDHKHHSLSQTKSEIPKRKIAIITKNLMIKLGRCSEAE